MNQYWSISGKKRIGKIGFFIKTVFLTIQVEIGEVWRCPGWPHGPYEDSAWHRKVHFSIFSGKLTFQSTRNGQKPSILSRVSPGHLYYFPRYLTNIFFKNILQKDKISRLGNLKIWKSKNPGSLTGAQFWGQPRIPWVPEGSSHGILGPSNPSGSPAETLPRDPGCFGSGSLD